MIPPKGPNVHTEFFLKKNLKKLNTGSCSCSSTDFDSFYLFDEENEGEETDSPPLEAPAAPSTANRPIVYIYIYIFF